MEILKMTTCIAFLLMIIFVFILFATQFNRIELKVESPLFVVEYRELTDAQ